MLPGFANKFSSVSSQMESQYNCGLNGAGIGIGWDRSGRMRTGVIGLQPLQRHGKFPSATLIRKYPTSYTHTHAQGDLDIWLPMAGSMSGCIRRPWSGDAGGCGLCRMPWNEFGMWFTIANLKTTLLPSDLECYISNGRNDNVARILTWGVCFRRRFLLTSKLDSMSCKWLNITCKVFNIFKIIIRTI